MFSECIVYLSENDINLSEIIPSTKTVKRHYVCVVIVSYSYVCFSPKIAATCNR